MTEDGRMGRYNSLQEPRLATLPEPLPPPDRCPRCGMPMVVGAVFCKACGSRPRPDPPKARPIPDAPWVATECPRCGRPMESGVVANSWSPKESGRLMTMISFFPPPKKGSRSITGEGDLIFRRPSFIRTRADQWPL
jgi:predicted amidophosphoribosyltransferase